MARWQVARGEVAKHVSRAGCRGMRAGPWAAGQGGGVVAAGPWGRGLWARGRGWAGRTSSKAVPWKRLCRRLSSDFLKILMAKLVPVSMSTHIFTCGTRAQRQLGSGAARQRGTSRCGQAQRHSRHRRRAQGVGQGPGGVGGAPSRRRLRPASRRSRTA